MPIEIRPKIVVQLKKADYLIELLAILFLVGIWIFSVQYYWTLPEIIPTHFNIHGEVDAHGSKGTLFIMPIVYSIIFVLLSIISRKPEIYNYPVKITADNAAVQYALATRMLRILKTLIGWILLSINWLTSISARNSELHGLEWIVFVDIALLFTAIFVYIIIARKNR